MAKLVEHDIRLQVRYENVLHTNEFNAYYHAFDGSVYVRNTSGHEEMRELADKLAEAGINNRPVDKEWEEKLIAWVTESIPGTTYYITLEFYSEPNLSGNMQEKYYIRRSKDTITLGGPAMRYRFVTRAAAVKAAKFLFNHYTEKQKEYGEKKQIKVILHEQYLTRMPQEIMKLYEGWDEYMKNK